MSLAIVLLAAGHGSRMKSKKQKILHEVGGKPMILHVFEAAEKVADQKPVIVIAPGETGVIDLVGDRAVFVEQAERLGTGHAAMMATAALAGQSDQVLVTYGDMPLLRAETMCQLVVQAGRAAVSLLTILGDVSSPFGRIVRDDAGIVREIVEAAEANQRENGAEILAIKELNAGIYCFDSNFLWQNLPHLPLRQARNGVEYYLTDMVGLAVAQNKLVEAVVCADADEGLGAGTRAELVQVEKAFQRRVNNYWLDNSVTIIDPSNTFIDGTVTIGKDTIIWPNCFLQGNTIIGEDCIIGPHVVLRNAGINDGQHVKPFTLINRVVPE